MIATEKLWLTADRRRVVREGDAAAAFLLAAKGSEIPKIYLPLVSPAKPSGAVVVNIATADAEPPVKVDFKESGMPLRRRR